MNTLKNFLSLLVVLLASTNLTLCLSGTKVKIEKKGYTGIIIAIDPSIPENEDLLDAIKQTWTNASRDLYIATKQLAYFKEITILLPTTWDAKDRDPVSGNDNCDLADVIIDSPNPIYGNDPYTEQYEGCGKPGSRSHFTPEFFTNEESVTNYGPRGKVVVHEWAHYRWGVYDETSDENPFYWDPDIGSYNGPEATRCPVSLYGEIRDINSTNAERHCSLVDIDEATNSYPSNCVFFPYEEQYYHPNTSMMCYQYMEEVNTFCHDEGEGSKHNTHNVNAPNDQNRLCNMKSTWTVIMESPDFASTTNLEISDTTPTFKIVRPTTSQRFVLVLDVSGSMGGWKIVTLRETAYKFITVYAPYESYVGIVEFDSYAHRLSDLTLLDSAKAREDLAAKLPTSANGGTCIGCGMEEGMAVFGGNPAAGHMIVITDGQGSGVEDVYDDVLEKGIIVDTVYIQTNANEILTQLTLDSGGNWFYTTDGNNLDQIFNGISSSECTDNNALQIAAETTVVPSGSPLESQVVIDATIGLSTTFVFTWSYGSVAPTIQIESPSGCVYTNEISSAATLCQGGNNSHTVSLDFKTIKFIIPGVAEVGTWVYIATSVYSQTITIVVTSEASDTSMAPIVVESGMSATDVSDGTATIVYAKVTQGYNPIIDANVTAIVGRPDNSRVTMSLYDNGAGADIRENDGIYSRYFTEYNGPGRYSVEVEVGSQNSGPKTTRKLTRHSRANYRPGLISPNGTANINENGAISSDGDSTAGNGIESEDIGDFSRVVSSGGFSYAGPSVTSDTFPPGQIIDVKLQQNDLTDYTKGVVLKFTAPGDDMDSGTASFYEIRFTYDDPTNLNRNFDKNDEIIQSDLIQGNLSDPSAAGTLENFVASTPALPPDKESVKLAFGIRATDAAGNIGTPSNVAVINFFIKPLVLTTLPPTTTKPETTKLTTKLLTTTKPATTKLTTKAPTTTKPKTTKLTVTKTTTTTKSTVISPTCAKCDPNTDLYQLLMISFAIGFGIFMSSTIVLSAWLCKVNNQIKSKKNTPHAYDKPWRLEDIAPRHSYATGRVNPAYSAPPRKIRAVSDFG